MKLLAQGKSLGGNIVPEAGGYNKVISADSSAPASTIELIITNVLTVFTIIGGLMFILYFVMGGLTWVSASGDKGKIEKARGMMTNAAIGLIVITLSYSIAWIVGKVLGIEILKPAEMIKNTITF